MADIKDLIFIDCETTGLDPAKHEIIEVAMVRVRRAQEADTQVGWKIMGTFHKMFMPLRDPEPEVAAINGFSRAKWEDSGAKLMRVRDLMAMAPLLDGATPAGQNPGFDMGFLRMEWGAAEAAESGGYPFPNVDYHLLDLATFAFPLYVGGLVSGLSLRHTRKLFGFDGEQEHRAIGDVLDAMQIFLHLERAYRMERPSQMANEIRVLAVDAQQLLLA